MSNRVTGRTVRLAATVAVVVWLAVARTAGAGEGDDPPEFHRDPGKGVPGTVVTVAGRGCSLDGQPARAAYVFLYRHAGTVGGPMYDASQGYPVAADGSWGGTFTVPGDAPPGPYTMTASCTAADFNWNQIEADFQVLDPATTTTTTHAPPPRPPPTTEPPPPPPTTALAETTVPETVVAPTSAETSLAAAPREGSPDPPGDASVVPAAVAAVAILVVAAGALAARRLRQ